MNATALLPSSVALPTDYRRVPAGVAGILDEVDQRLENAAGTAAPQRPESTSIRRLAMVVRDDAFDRLLTPLAFACEMGSRGTQVDILFVLWASRVMTRDGVRDVRIDPRYADREAWLRQRLADEGAPTDLIGFIQAAVTTGSVRLYACQLASETFGVRKEDLLPECAGIVHPVRFLNEVARRADHCQYF